MYNYLENQKKEIILLIGVIGVAIVGYIDYATGTDFSLSLFFLIPIFFVAWFAGQGYGLIVSILSAVAWHLANRLAGAIPGHLIYYWNTLIRFGFFAIVTLLVSRLKLALAQEKRLSRVDFLTGAVNSRAFYEIVEKEIYRARRYGHSFTVAYLDVDNFKRVNDRFGHIVGNDVLTRVVATISQHLRSSDVIGRLGGDEFAILLFETGYNAAQGVIRKIRRILINEMSDHGYPVTFSIGMLTCDVPPESVEELIRMVDQLMYSAKESGKDAIRFSLFQER